MLAPLPGAYPDSMASAFAAVVRSPPSRVTRLVWHLHQPEEVEADEAVREQQEADDTHDPQHDLA